MRTANGPRAIAYSLLFGGLLALSMPAHSGEYLSDYHGSGGSNDYLSGYHNGGTGNDYLSDYNNGGTHVPTSVPSTSYGSDGGFVRNFESTQWGSKVTIEAPHRSAHQSRRQRHAEEVAARAAYHNANPPCGIYGRVPTRCLRGH